MNRIITSIGLITLILISEGCRERKTNIPGDVPVINLDIDTISRYNLDSMVTNVRFVPLETNSECLIGKYDDVKIVGERIYILSNSGTQQIVFVFDLNGKYLFKVDAHGRGPGEYLHASSFFVNRETGQIGILDQLKAVMFDSDGKYSGSHTFDSIYPGQSTVCFSGKYYTCALEYDALFISPDDPEKEFNTIDIFDDGWNLISHDYPIRKQLIQSMFARFSGTLFAPSGDTLFFLHPDSYTVYHLDNIEFNPRYYLNFGDYGISEKELSVFLATQPDMQSYYKHFVDNKLRLPGSTRLYASENYLLIQSGIANLLHLFIYDRQSGKSGYVEKGGIITGKVLLSDIRSHENRFYSVIESSKIISARNLITAGNVRQEQIFSGPFSPDEFSGFYDVSRDNLTPGSNPVIIEYMISN